MVAAMVGAFLIAVPAAAPPAQPAASDEEVWALAQRVDLVPAYDTYLRRFPDGLHFRAAADAIGRLEGRPVIFAPPAPPAPRAPVVFPTAPDPCTSLLADQLTGGSDSDEAQAFLVARRTNRLSDYRAYVRDFPAGACQPEASQVIARREEFARSLMTVAGFGPLAPQRRHRVVFTSDDYPASALRNNERGRVVAEWEVAEDGFVESCRVSQSSGSPALDRETCRIITRRLRYDPARDASGAPTRATDQQAVNWAMAGEDPPAHEAVSKGK